MLRSLKLHLLWQPTLFPSNLLWLILKAGSTVYPTHSDETIQLDWEQENENPTFSIAADLTMLVRPHEWAPAVVQVLLYHFANIGLEHVPPTF